jgi:hypothetical protein
MRSLIFGALMTPVTTLSWCGGINPRNDLPVPTTDAEVVDITVEQVGFETDLVFHVEDGDRTTDTLMFEFGAYNDFQARDLGNPYSGTETWDDGSDGYFIRVPARALGAHCEGNSHYTDVAAYIVDINGDQSAHVYEEEMRSEGVGEELTENGDLVDEAHELGALDPFEFYCGELDAVSNDHVNPTGDEDWLHFEAPHDTVIYAVLHHDLDDDYDLLVVDADGDEVEKASTQENPEIMKFPVHGGDEYSVRVAGWDGAADDYELALMTYDHMMVYFGL